MHLLLEAPHAPTTPWPDLQLACISRTIYPDMPNLASLRCDGCGQVASAEHIARRLERLEWATRYRPVHLHTLLLGSLAPREDADYLYSPRGEFRGEAAQLLQAVGISFAGKPAEAVQAEFQAAGFFLAHILECPLKNGDSAIDQTAILLGEHLPSLASRIRRSLKPRRVILVTEFPLSVVQDLLTLSLNCPVVLDEGRPFRFGPSGAEASFSRFRELLRPAKGN